MAGASPPRSVRLPSKLDKRVCEELGADGNFNQFVIEALWLKLTKEESKARAHEYRELNLTPGRSSSVDDMMEWILARQPLVWDMMTVEGELDSRVVRAVRKELPPTQARRVVFRFKGLTLEEIGRKEGCSKQAVHTSLSRGLDALSQSTGFAGTLLRVLSRDEDSYEGLTPEVLVQAVRERRGR